MRTFVLTALAAAAASTVVGGSARASGSVCPTMNHPNELVLAGGRGQTAQLGKPFAQSLQVKLANTNGCPLSGNLAGITVNFDAPASGASGIFADSGSRESYVGTDSDGVATSPSFTANFTVGDYTVDAHSDYGTVGISLSNTASGLPSAVASTWTTGQEAVVNGSYGRPLQARVTDANGNPVQGADVTFAILPGPTGADASFLGGTPTATTDSNGLATSPPLVANGVPGRFTATASTSGVSTVATFGLDNHAAATTLRTISMRSPKATVGARYRSSLQATVLDSTGQPIEGATVTFGVTADADGASAAFVGGTGQATALTDASGVATAPPLVANKTAGTFTATATALASNAGQYTLENVAAAPASVTAGVASGESATVGTRFAIPLAVTVVDKNGNPVASATVTFAAPKRGASGFFAVKHHERRVVRVKTNAKGIAVAPRFTAGASVGGYVVTARVKSARAAVSLINLPG